MLPLRTDTDWLAQTHSFISLHGMLDRYSSSCDQRMLGWDYAHVQSDMTLLGTCGIRHISVFRCSLALTAMTTDATLTGIAQYWYAFHSGAPFSSAWNISDFGVFDRWTEFFVKPKTPAKHSMEIYWYLKYYHKSLLYSAMCITLISLYSEHTKASPHPHPR